MSATDRNGSPPSSEPTPAEAPSSGRERPLRWENRPAQAPAPEGWKDQSAFEWRDVVDFYELLEVSPRASAEVIRKAYQALALKRHPDRQPPEQRPAAEQKMRLLNLARDTLLDPDRRREYDLKRLAKGKS